MEHTPPTALMREVWHWKITRAFAIPANARSDNSRCEQIASRGVLLAVCAFPIRFVRYSRPCMSVCLHRLFCVLTATISPHNSTEIIYWNIFTFSSCDSCAYLLVSFSWPWNHHDSNNSSRVTFLATDGIVVSHLIHPQLAMGVSGL